RDLDALVLVEHGELVIDHLDDDEGGVPLDESGVDHVVRLDVAAALVLGLGIRQRELALEALHRAARTRGREADVIAVYEGRTPIERLVARVAHGPQTYVGPARHVRHGAAV